MVSRLRLVSAALAAGALVASPLAADAVTKSFDDPADDSGKATDVRTVTVRYAARLKVVARYPGSTLEGSFLRYWLNTRPRNPGPEYVVVVVPNSDSFGIIAINKWSQTRRSPVDCPGFRANADIFAKRPRTWIKVPASCIEAPGRVAVAMQTRHGKQSDWIKAPRRFLGFVKRD